MADKQRTTAKEKSIRKPTPRMVKAAAIMVENGGKQGPALREAGYSEAIVNSPSKITRSQAFQQLMIDMGVDDNRLIGVLKDGLEATKTVIIAKDEDAFADQVADHRTRHKYLETGLRLSGLGKAEPSFNFNFHQHVGEQQDRYPI